MTWLKFSVCLAVLYLVYYGLLIVWDILRAKREPTSADKNELTFIEDAAPVKVTPDNGNPEPTAQTSSIISSGGVLLKEIFKLAQEEAIEYIRPVSF
jgi:hypothetical protein